MAQPITPNFPLAVTYPDSDGQPMADNTKQFRWIVVIKDNLERLFAQDPVVFVAGDLLWYPVEGKPTVRQAPDVMVVLGRPKGDRGSYQQWREGDIAPQEGWVSPRLGIRFELTSQGLEIYYPDGERFSGPAQLSGDLDDSESFKIPPSPLTKGGVQSPFVSSPLLQGGRRQRGDSFVASQDITGSSNKRVLRADAALPPKSPNNGGLQALVPPRIGGVGGPNHSAIKQRPTPKNSTLTGQQLQQRIEALETKLRELGVDPESL